MAQWSVLATLLLLQSADVGWGKRLSADDASNRMESGFAKRGFCPSRKFGGGQGNAFTNGKKIIRFTEDLLMVKVFWAQHLPSGGGFITEDVPDLYVQINVNGQKGQTQVIKDSWSPFFGDHCYFTTKEKTVLKMDLWDRDKFSRDDYVGTIMLNSTAANCKNGAVQGECYEDFNVLGKDKKPVKGKDGKETLLTVGFKYIYAQLRAPVWSNPAFSMFQVHAGKTDTDGFCPPWGFGGKPPKGPGGQLLLLKMVRANHLPSGSYLIKEDKPDLYIEMKVGKLLGQTHVVRDNYDPTLSFDCVFPHVGFPDVEVNLWEHNSGSFDSYLGHFGPGQGKKVQINLKAMLSEHCQNLNNGEYKCRTPVYDKGGQLLMGKDKAGTEVYFMIKFIDLIPVSSVPAPMSLGF